MLAMASLYTWHHPVSQPARNSLGSTPKYNLEQKEAACDSSNVHCDVELFEQQNKPVIMLKLEMRK